MDKQLEGKLPHSAKSIWRIYSFIQIALLSVVYIFLLYILDDYLVLPLYVKIVAGLVLVTYFFVIALIIPNVRWAVSYTHLTLPTTILV